MQFFWKFMHILCKYRTQRKPENRLLRNRKIYEWWEHFLTSSSIDFFIMNVSASVKTRSFFVIFLIAYCRCTILHSLYIFCIYTIDMVFCFFFLYCIPSKHNSLYRAEWRKKKKHDIKPKIIGNDTGNLWVCRVSLQAHQQGHTIQASSSPSIQSCKCSSRPVRLSCSLYTVQTVQ